MSAVVVAGAGDKPRAIDERRRRRPPRAAIPFQGDVTAIETRPVPLWARSTILLVAALLAAAIVWAAMAPIDKVVQADGRLVTRDPKLALAPLEISVVRTIDVRSGDVVRKGQVLARLDPTFAAADTASLTHKLAADTAEIERLQAEVDGRTYIPSNLNADSARQRVLFNERALEHAARLQAFDKAAAALEAERTGLATTAGFTQQRLDLAREASRMRAQLVRQQNNSKLQLLDADERRLELEQDAAANTDKMKGLEQELAKSTADRLAFEREWLRGAVEDLTRLERDRDATQEDLTKARRRSALVDLRAPQDAVVLDVNQHYSLGSVIEAAQTLVTLVPLATPLEVLANVEAADIGDVRVGDPVRIKLQAFPFQRHGLLEGRVVTISDDALPPDGATPAPGRTGVPGKLAYRARIALTSTALRDVRPDLKLLPGMALTAEIKVGGRTVLSYILYPIIRTMDESLKEP